MRVEVLYFDGCPNWPRTHFVLDRLLDELGVQADVVPVHVADAEDAQRLRFLGSPTVRVDGRDVEPGADERTEFALGCRVYSSNGRISGEPDEQWIRTALLEAR
jgi:hypothetical protein